MTNLEPKFQQYVRWTVFARAPMYAAMSGWTYTENYIAKAGGYEASELQLWG